MPCTTRPPYRPDEAKSASACSGLSSPATWSPAAWETAGRGIRPARVVNATHSGEPLAAAGSRACQLRKCRDVGSGEGARVGEVLRLRGQRTRPRLRARQPVAAAAGRKAAREPATSLKRHRTATAKRKHPKRKQKRFSVVGFCFHFAFTPIIYTYRGPCLTPRRTARPRGQSHRVTS